MEGISAEAASLAGHLKLSNLCWIYDNNRITIEGNTALAFSEDVATRFIGQGWNVTRVGDANDREMLARAFETFRREDDRPTLIIVDSHIAYGAPSKQDTSAAHGEPLGEEEIRLTKRAYGWPEDAELPRARRRARALRRRDRRTRARAARGVDGALRRATAPSTPSSADHLLAMQRRELPEGWDADIPTFDPDAKGLAGREASGKVLNAIAPRMPWLIGGAADLAPSTKTRLTFEGAGDFSAEDRGGRNLHFGVREHAMSAAVNGLALSKVRGLRLGLPDLLATTARAPLRLAAIMEIPTIHIFTHDSIGVGEDGPTHQPIEHLASLRAMPGIVVIRPGDANEVAEAWRLTMELQHDPVVLVLSRQAMPTLDRSRYAPADGVRRGAYVLADPPEGDPEVLLLASGTEVALVVAAHEQLTQEGVRSRVVSMPSWELFERQDAAYREQVLPPQVTARVGVEQAEAFGWDRYVGPTGPHARPCASSAPRRR